MGEREGAITRKGDEEGHEFARSLFLEFGLPLGLLPLQNVIEGGFVESTGYFWIVQESRTEHRFEKIGMVARYEKEISGYVSLRKVRKLKGVKAKKVLVWYPLSEITVDDGRPEIIRFKAVIASVPFPVDAFAAGQ
uniref:Uncharacterized protein n=1 Tax=Kalanchoe fedtschenkoi TaxID=63787 RepID=A0A7N0TCM0_KALFE